MYINQYAKFLLKSEAHFWNSPHKNQRQQVSSIIPFTMFSRKTNVDRLFKTEPMTKVIKVDRQLGNETNLSARSGS